MALKLHNLKPAKGAKKTSKRLGRGNSSGSGNFSGRGSKGQRARSGGKGGLKFRGLKANIQNIPKLSGFKSLKAKFEIVNLKDIEKSFKDKDIVTPAKLTEKQLIKRSNLGVKVLGSGKLSKNITLKVNRISASAKQAVESAGGKVFLIADYVAPVKVAPVKKEAKKTVSKK